MVHASSSPSRQMHHTGRESKISSPRGHATLCATTAANVIASSSSKRLASATSLEDVLDMLCPICEDSCSCQASTKLTITSTTGTGSSSALGRRKRAKAVKKARTAKQAHLEQPKRKQDKAKEDALNKRQHYLTSTKGPKKTSIRKPTRKHEAAAAEAKARAKRQHCEELDKQYALSEYYFSEDEEELDKYEAQDECYDGEGYVDEESVTVYAAATAEEGNDTDIFAEYYGYTSSSDIAIDSLFLSSSSGCDSEDEVNFNDGVDHIRGREELGVNNNSSSSRGSQEERRYRAPDLFGRYYDLRDEPVWTGTTTNTMSSNANITGNSTTPPTTGRSSEELLVEQLAKITPQILAAISVAAKGHSNSANSSRTYYIETTASPGNSPLFPSSTAATDSTSLRLDDLLDTKKLALFLSTSPRSGEPSPLADSTQCARRRPPVPIDAFRRRNRRNSLPTRNLTGALRQPSMANCTLLATPDPSYCMTLDVEMEISVSDTSGFSPTQEGSTTAAAALADVESEEDDHDPYGGGMFIFDGEDLFTTAGGPFALF